MYPANLQEPQVRNLRILCLLVTAAMMFGLWLHLPYLAVEHRRLETWKIVGLWIGDVMALLWFARFVYVHAGLGEPLAPIPLADGKRRVRFVTMAVAAAIIVDLGFTLFLMREAREGYARGKMADAQITKVTVQERAEASWYHLECSFTDEHGQRRQAPMRVQAKHGRIPDFLPPDTVRALAARTNGPIRIRYAEEFPTRAWVDGLGWDDGNSIYWFSLLTLFFQAIVAALFLLLLQRQAATGYLPWWWDIYNALPLAVETFWMLTMGLIDRWLDSL